MRFRRKEFQTASAARKSRRAVMAIAILTIIPSLLMTVGIVRRSISDNNVNRFIKTELSQSGTQVISSDLDRDNQILNIVAVGREINDSTIRVAQKNLVHYSLADIKLNIIQGEKSDSAMRLGKKLSQITTSREEEKQKMVEMSAKLSETSNSLEQYTRLEQLTPDVMAEMRNLFPQVNALSLSKVAQSRRDTTATMHFVAAIISLDPKARLTPADRQRIHDWLQTRVKADSLVVY